LVLSTPLKTLRDIELDKVGLYLQLQDPSLIPRFHKIIEQGASVPISEKDGKEFLAALEDFAKGSGHDPTDEMSIYSSIRFWKKFIS